MWKQAWDVPPQDRDELFAWRVYTRCWDDIGARAPGIWVASWMKKETPTGYALEAIFWYLNECKE